ncbi:MAG: MarR family winged helix-turn-helix transcriptional regulator [Thermoflexaceae bacterium]|nr:MarR family winged helix-turn-helix transcriptional regulator [Thermoflexaceae bacterium]
MDNRENAVGFLVRELGNELRKKRERCKYSDDMGNITMMQSWVIGYLAHNTDHDVFQRELETELNIGKSTLTELLHLMEKNDLVCRMSSNNDGRCKRIVLTDRARQIDSIISKDIVETERKLKEGIPEEDIEVFLRTIKKMIFNISERSL